MLRSNMQLILFLVLFGIGSILLCRIWSKWEQNLDPDKSDLFRYKGNLMDFRIIQGCMWFPLGFVLIFIISILIVTLIL